jgi:S-adenosyl-L-methionine hydrolase (adenosine-forming)
MARTTGIVALLTDYGLQDAYVGILKGALLSANPKARLVDLTHEIPPQDVREASRVLDAAHPYFPDGTVFVAVVDPGVGTDRAVVAAETRRHYFLAPDNGLLDFLRRGGELRRAVRVTQTRYFRTPVSSTFHGRDIFAPVAARIAAGLDLARLGPRVRTLAGSGETPVVSRGSRVSGRVVAVDRFGNLITDIPSTLLRTPKNIRIRTGRVVLRSLSRTYSDVRKGALAALVGSTGHLEISANQGNASRLTRVRKGAPVRVDWPTS